MYAVLRYFMVGELVHLLGGDGGFDDGCRSLVFSKLLLLMAL